MKRRVFRGRICQDADEGYCSTALYGRSLPSLYQANDAFLGQIPFHMLTKNRCRSDNDGRISVSMTRVADRCSHFGHPQRRQQSVVSCDIVPSKASAYCCDGVQMTTLHPVREYPLALLAEAFHRCLVKERLFFIHVANVGRETPVERATPRILLRS